ncbi:NAD(P)-dependent oxidoreductase, partial [Salmonella enterica]|uniref:NAD(P)-dependent oxidoreductase n=1 Tax=Salmonella enterica TaxID=28901 RepID=UPI0019D82C11
PLNKNGPYQSLHMADDELLAALPDGRILINACRGAVVDNTALLRALEKGKKLSVVLDVWEPEPELTLPLLARVDIGTPHIAGYTL